MLKSKLYDLLIEPVISFAMPALCISCKNPLHSGRRIICTSCFNQLPPLPGTHISALKTEITDANFSNIIIVYQFSKPFQDLIHLFKYQRYLTLAAYFAEAFSHRFDLSGYDIITSVPLNPVKEKERGYNQSALLASGLGKLLGVPVDNRLIKRTRNTVSQTKLHKDERYKNVAAAFECDTLVKDKRILLIDDVVTTGSTLNECAKVLMRQQARSVDIAALATPMDYLQQELEKGK